MEHHDVHGKYKSFVSLRQQLNQETCSRAVKHLSMWKYENFIYGWD